MIDTTGWTYRDAWRVAFGEKGRLWHVRAVVDGCLIVRCWSKSKGWVYKIENMPLYSYKLGAFHAPSRPFRAWLDATAKVESMS